MMESPENPAPPPPRHPVPPIEAFVPPEPAPRPSRKSVWVVLAMLFLGFGGFMVVMIVGLAGLSGSGSKVKEEWHSLEKSATNKIAVLKLEGMILEGDGYFKDQLDRIKEDENVKAIVLRVDSPGGTVTGSDYMFHHLKKLLEDKEIRRPMVVSMGSLCASGGYYVAMAAGAQKEQKDVIFAEPTTWSGSIGVLIPHYDLSGLAERFDIRDDSVKSHPLKAMGGMLTKMTDEERAIFKGLVDEMFVRFKDIVKFGRPNLSEENLTQVATGQIFTTKQAIQWGLVDKEGFIEEAIARAAELAKLDVKKTMAVEYSKEPSFSDLFMGQAQSRVSLLPTSAEGLLDFTTPRAYYMFSLAPGLNTRRP